jgi:hypothetical protein
MVNRGSGSAVRNSRWAPLAALVIAGVVLVVHGEPRPVQQYSGVSVPVKTGSTAPVAADLPALLVLQDGALSRIQAGVSTPVALPTGVVAVSVQQVSQSASAAMALYPDGLHAFLVPSGGAGMDLGRADRMVAGEAPAVVAVQLDRLVSRFDLAGAAVGDRVPLPPALDLAADSALGLLASSVVGLIAVPAASGDAPSADQVTAVTRTALQRGDRWVPMGTYQPLAARGNIALLWNPLLRQVGLLDLTRLDILQSVPAAELAAPEDPASATPTATPSGSPSASPSPSPTPSDSPSAESPVEPVPDVSTPVVAVPSDLSSPDPVLPDTPTGSGTPVADPTASLAPQVARGLLPVAYPSLLGVSLTGPASFSPDGRWVSIAGQVGARPRMVVGAVPVSIVRGDTELVALDVISLGGDLLPGQAQPAPVWVLPDLISAKLDGTVVLFSTVTRRASGQPLATVAISTAAQPSGLGVG